MDFCWISVRLCTDWKYIIQNGRREGVGLGSVLGLVLWLVLAFGVGFRVSLGSV